MSAVCSCSEDKTSSSSEPWDSSNSDSDEGNDDAFLQAQRRLRKCQKLESHLLSDIQSLTQEKNMLKGENTCLTMENAFLKEQVLEKQYERDSFKVQWWEEKQEFLLKIGQLEDQCRQNQLHWDGRLSEIRTAEDQELDKLRDDNRVLIERNRECEDQVRELVSRLHTKTESLNKLNGDLKQQLREVSNGVIQLRLVLSELGQDFEAERNQVASEMLNTQMSFKQTTDALTAELCSRQDEVNQLRSKIQSDERSFRERTEAHDTLVTELKSSNSEMEEEMKKLSTESERLKSDLEREQQMNKRLSSDLSNLQAEYREVQVSKSTLYQTVVHLEQTINNNLMEYNSETSSLKTQISELHKDLQIKTSEINRMSVEASELNNQFENCKKGRCTRQDCGMIQDNYQVLVNEHNKLQELYKEQHTQSTRMLTIIADLESQCESFDGKAQIESNIFSGVQKVEELKQQDIVVQETTENTTEELQEQLTVLDESTEKSKLYKDLQINSTEITRTREEDSELKNETEKVVSGLQERQDTSQDSEIVQDNYQVLEDDHTKFQELYEEQQAESTRLSNITSHVESQSSALDDKVQTESNTFSEAQKTLTELNKALSKIVEELKQQDIVVQQTTENTREELQEQLTVLDESHKCETDRLETEIPEQSMDLQIKSTEIGRTTGEAELKDETEKVVSGLQERQDNSQDCEIVQSQCEALDGKAQYDSSTISGVEKVDELKQKDIVVQETTEDITEELQEQLTVLDEAHTCDSERLETEISELKLYGEQQTDSTRLSNITPDLESQSASLDRKAQIESNTFSEAQKTLTELNKALSKIVEELKQQDMVVQQTTENTRGELQEQLTVTDETHKCDSDRVETEMPELNKDLQINSTKITRTREEDSELKNETEKVVSGLQERQDTSQDSEIVQDNYQVLEDDETKHQELYEEHQTESSRLSSITSDSESESSALDEKVKTESNTFSEAQKSLTELNKALNEIVEELKQQDVIVQQTTENTTEELQEQLTVLDKSHKRDSDSLETETSELYKDLQVKSSAVNRTTREAELMNETEKVMSQERQGTSQDCEIVQSQCASVDGQAQYDSNTFSGAQKVDELKQQDIVVQETTEDTTEELQEQLTVLDEAHTSDSSRLETEISELKLQEEQQTESTRLSHIIPDLESQSAALDEKVKTESNTFSEAQKTLTELNKALNEIVEELKQQEIGVQATTQHTREELQEQLTVLDKSHQQETDRLETETSELYQDESGGKISTNVEMEVGTSKEQSKQINHCLDGASFGKENTEMKNVSEASNVEEVPQEKQSLEESNISLSGLDSYLTSYVEDKTNKLRGDEVSRNVFNDTLHKEVYQLEEIIGENEALVDQIKQERPEPKTEGLTSREMWEQLTMLRQDNCQLVSENSKLAAEFNNLQARYNKVLEGPSNGNEYTVPEESNVEETQEKQSLTDEHKENIRLSGLVPDLTSNVEDETNKPREEEVSSGTLLNEEPKTEGLTSSEMLEQLTMLRQENHQLVLDKSNLAADLNNLQSRYKKVLADKREQYQKALSDLHNLRTQLVCAKEDIENIQGLWNETKDSLERRVTLESKNTVEGFEEQLKKQTEEVRQLKKQCRTLEENLTFLTKTNEEREKQDKEATEKREIERDSLLVTVGDLEKKLKLSKNEVTDYINEANELKDVISKRDSVIEQRNADVNGLRSQVSEMQHQLSEAELDLMKRDDLLSNQIEERKQYEQLVTELREILDVCKQENARLKKELEDRQEDEIFKNLSEELSESTLSENSEEGPSNSVSPNQSLSAEQPIPSDYEEPKNSTSDVQHPKEEEYAEEEDKSDSGFEIVLQRLSTTENEVSIESSEMGESETSTDNETEEQSTGPPPPESAAVNTEAKPSTFKQVAKRVGKVVLGLSAWALTCSVCYILGQQDMMSCDPLSYYSSSCYKYDISGTGIPF